MKHRRENIRSINVRTAFAYGRSDMDEMVDEIIATENIGISRSYNHFGF